MKSCIGVMTLGRTTAEYQPRVCSHRVSEQATCPCTEELAGGFLDDCTKLDRHRIVVGTGRTNCSLSAASLQPWLTGVKGIPLLRLEGSLEDFAGKSIQTLGAIAVRQADVLLSYPGVIVPALRFKTTTLHQ